MRIPAGKQVLTVCFDDVSGFELESIAFAQQRTDAPTAKPVAATAKPTVRVTVKPTVAVPVEKEEAPPAKKPATVAEPAAVAPKTPAPTPKATKAVPTAAPTAAKPTGQYYSDLKLFVYVPFMVGLTQCTMRAVQCGTMLYMPSTLMLQCIELFLLPCDKQQCSLM
jgi:hypothetical protein